MRQVFIFHGGDSYSSYNAYINGLKTREIDYEHMKKKSGWRDTIAESLKDTDVLFPSMPNSSNAVFDEWVIIFEKLIPYFGNDVRLVGLSLGATFLTKYLNIHRLPKPVKQVHLLAGAYNMGGEDLGSFGIESAKGVGQNAESIHLYHSHDDPVVPFSELAKFRKDLPNASVHIFSNRGHFSGETFPELIEVLGQK